MGSQDEGDAGSTGVPGCEELVARPDPDDPRKPRSLHELRGKGWRQAARRAGMGFLRDSGFDLAAGLSFYSVLSTFPALLAIFSVVGLLGQQAGMVDAMLEVLAIVAPDTVVDFARGPLTDLASSDASGWTLLAGVLGALWTASGYVGVFGRMVNSVYGITEGRGIVRLKLEQLAITISVLVLVSVLLVGFMVSGPIAERVTWLLGWGTVGLQVFNLVKWPVLLLMAVALIAVLYYFAPNVHQPRFRWLSVGAGVSLLLWLLISSGLAFYVSNLARYTITYGALGSVIVFLLWTWLSNCSLVLGAEIDAELERARELQAGLPAERRLLLPPRATAAEATARRRVESLVLRSRRIRIEAARRQSGAHAASADEKRTKPVDHTP